MKILVVGSGGREHVLSWALRRSAGVMDVFAVPGNPGMLPGAQPVPGKIEDLESLADIAENLKADLTVVGPEAPLCKGITDVFKARGLKVFGPSAQAAEIEGSKIFAKEFMVRHNIPTARHRVFTEHDKALAYIKYNKGSHVIKADGLAAGKGVFICDTPEEAETALNKILTERAFGDIGQGVIIEEKLEGEECSFMVLCDGERVVKLASSQDHKRALDEDKGPNTGGMGAYSPAPIVTKEVEDRIMNTVIKPAIKGLAEEGRPYQGVLYAGLMIKEGLPFVLEFNCRFGDPEAQAVLVRLGEDLAPLLKAVAEGELEERDLKWDPRTALCVVMASKGYPGEYEKGIPIDGLDDVENIPDVRVFFSGVATDPEDGQMMTSGGRVLGVTALGDGISDAQVRAYDAVGKIHWDGAFYRKDIGDKGLKK